MSLDLTVIGDKKILATLAKWEREIPEAIQQSVHQSALELNNVIVKGLRDQAPGGKKIKPLAQSTVDRRRTRSKSGARYSTKALIDNGDLIRSIKTHKLRGLAAYFVGVHRTERAKSKENRGESLVNIATIHEFGTKPTHKTHPGIPARPFLRPGFKMWRKGVEQELLTSIACRIGMIRGGFQKARIAIGKTRSFFGRR